MIDQSQLSNLTKKYQTNSTVILREYVQLLFLETLYSIKGSKDFIFKGGTAVHLIYGAPRFSEDLDFTVTCTQETATTILDKLFIKMKEIGDYSFKPKDTITGLRYLMTIHVPVVSFTIFMNLDFSFREATLSLGKSILQTEFPITTNSLIHHMDQDEIVSEKIRAILTRDKGRDIYDLWYLLGRGGKIHKDWVTAQFSYYEDKKLDLSSLENKISSFPAKNFVEDLRPFVPESHRDQLADRYKIIQSELIKKINKSLA